MEKKDIRVSDAIPQRPASFDDAVERTLASVAQKEQKEQKKETPVRAWKTENTSTRKRSVKRSVLDIVGIAAIFVVCVVAIGTVIGVRAHLNRTSPASEIAELPTAPVNMSNTVYVSTVDELLAALAPDTRIVLADGTYNLTEASDYGTEGKEYYTWEDRSDNWFREPEENSFELTLRNLENCCITGSRNAEIVTVPRTAAVIYAHNCPGLVLSGFTAGHTVMADPCEGEVIRLVECPDAWVEDCSLYGCGTWGVSAVDCDDLTVTGSDIHECSSGGVSFVRCRNTLLSNCLLRNCGYRDNAFSIVYIYDCKDLRVTGCDIYENRTDVLFNLYGDDVENGMGEILILGTSVHDNEVLDQGFYSYTTRGPVVAGCEFKNNDGVLLSDEGYVFDRDGNRLSEADLLAMQLDRTLDKELEPFPTLEPQTPEEPTPEPEPAEDPAVDPAADALCLFVDGDREYEPFENWVWTDQDDGLAADGMSFLFQIEKVKDKIPTIYNPAELTIKTADGVNLEPGIRIYDEAINTVAFGADISTVRTLDPGTYYLSQRVSRRETDRTSGYECVVRVVIDPDEIQQPTPEPEPTEELAMEESSAIPSTFRFWDYDEQNGYSEAPAEGVLFVCDFDGDGTEEEIRYEIHGSSVTFSVGKASIDVEFGAGLEQAILLDLDPDSARLNLLVVYNTGSEDYETAELHMENGRFVRGPVIYAYCNFDDGILRGSATQTDILGTKFGERTYHGEDLTPDSEWFDCDVIPDYIPTARDRESLIENGKLLHLVRDLPCTIDGEAAVIPAGTYIYMTRWHDSWTLAEIRTEDGTVTALVTVERADPNDPELYGYLIDGETQDTYFNNIFYAD